VTARPPDHDPEQGSIGVAVIVMGMMLLAVAGLIIDSSRLLTARSRAVAYAEEAARAGAQGVDPLSTPLVLSEASVEDRVAAYCREVELREPTVTDCKLEDVDVVNSHVTASASITIQTGLLGLVNIQELTASGTGEAKPYFGVTGEDAR
jgi:hypothetical protein